MKYRFVYKYGGWWLKISTVEELLDYKKSTKDPIIDDGLQSALTCREFGGDDEESLRQPHVNRAGYLIGLRAQNNKTGLLEAAFSLSMESDIAKIRELQEGNNLYFNRVGGWHFGKNDYTQWCDSDKLIFPEFEKDEIRIEQFPMGEHYYAYIGNMQVRDGNTLKWDTYEEAYSKAMQYVEK